ncbi:MAG: PQQ-binding-like beta-propeller repeat protein [Marmoricola sp.]
MSRRAWIIGLVALALVLAAGGAYAFWSRDGCGSTVTSLSAAKSSSPFLDAEDRAEQPDRDRDELVRTLAADPAPIGEVVGAVGYHYEQWAQVSAYDQGIGVRTRDNPDFTMLDDRTLKPLWSVQVDTKRSTYDASAQRYLVATMTGDRSPEVVALDADTGQRAWCTELETGPVHEGDPFATQILDDEGVAVLTGGTGEKEHLVRINGRSGQLGWQRTIDAGSADFIGDLGDGTLLAGGRPQFKLFDAESMARRRAGPALVLVRAGDGKTIWTRQAAAGVDVHVLGTDPDSRTAFVQEWNSRTKSTRLLALDERGNQVWYAVPNRGGYFDAALRAGRILVRAGDRWSAYDITDGDLLWQRTMPNRPQFLPYGFELDSVPLLDEDHVLLGTTAALRTLDLDTGAMTSAALPTDGINTTFWPYQVAVSPGLIAVATNTGAAVVRRE